MYCWSDAKIYSQDIEKWELWLNTKRIPLGARSFVLYYSYCDSDDLDACSKHLSAKNVLSFWADNQREAASSRFIIFE